MSNKAVISCCVAMSPFILGGCNPAAKEKKVPAKPNVVLIYIDDLGFGDVSCNGATKVSTPNVDRIAAEGIRFSNGHASSATCTPSRFSMLTGQYAFRQQGTGIAPGDASLIIDPERITIADIFQKAGYKTGVVGKWHLGLGGQEGPDWNGDIYPGPRELGFDYSFLIPATGDRVPCVYVENQRVVGLDPNDPIQVSFEEKIGNEPTGKDHPELLKQMWSHGHNFTIINGISRIGYMSGGKAARWVDEDMADMITGKALNFIEQHQKEPFFLYFSTHDIHVPRVPHSRFAGKSGLGYRGDAILQMDWCVGQVLDKLEQLGLKENTVVIFSSDNGPVLDDGYVDEAVTKLNGHNPSGPLRGGKYSAFDAGTRVPFLISWPGIIKPGVSETLVSQVDFMASFAHMLNVPLEESDAPDSFNTLDAFLGKSGKDRDHLIEHAGALSVIKGEWKYIEPKNGPRISKNTNIEMGNDPEPQLYNLKDDIGEIRNLAAGNPEKVKELASILQEIRDRGRSRQ
ncbi:MAG: arylsulfatase [Prolixibacteraceae bacterium]|jgi:arylsulfatase A-like enzyme|nr:arylsulfatase [Prolixibacteraceae bacterium]